VFPDLEAAGALCSFSRGLCLVFPTADLHKQTCMAEVGIALLCEGPPSIEDAKE
jgi:hypothetical protein